MLLLLFAFAAAFFQMPPSTTGGVGGPASCSGVICLIAKVGGASTNKNNVTTTAINTTNATLLVVVESYFAGSSTAPTSSPTACTFSSLTVQINSSYTEQLWYCYSPTTSTSQTFSFSPGSTTYPAIAVLAFGGTSGSSVDVNAGTAVASTSTSIQPGNVSPSNNGEVCVSGIGQNATTSVAINDGFIIGNIVASIAAESLSVSSAYLIQSTATAENPTWTWTTARSTGGTNACFQ